MSAYGSILSPFTGSFLGGFGFAWQPVPVLDDRDVPDKTPKPSEPVERPYQPWTTHTGFGCIPGFDTAPPPSPSLWWQMRRYPTIVLAHAITTAPILAGMRTIEVASDGGNPELAAKIKAAAEADLLPLLELVLEGAMECLHFGHWLYGLTWDRRDGRTVPVSAQSLLPGEAILYQDKYRNFTGFLLGQEYRDARYAFLCVNQPHVDPILGYSRNENCREEWWRARQSDANADKIERKPSSVQMMIGMPQGQSFVDEKGQPVLPEKVAQTITNAAQQGATFTVPLTPFARRSIEANPALANIPAVKVDRFDWGNIGPALEAHLSRLDRIKTDIMRAWRRPEREAMEGQNGTKAEAGTHGAIGTTDSELVHTSVCRQWDAQVTEKWKRANFGGAEKVRIFTKPAPLSDPQQQFLQDISKLLAQSPTAGPEFTRQLNLRGLGEKTELPLLSEEDVEKKKQDQQKEAADAMKVQQDVMKAKGQQQDGAPAGVNGNGKKPAMAQGGGRFGKDAGGDGEGN